MEGPGRHWKPWVPLWLLREQEAQAHRGLTEARAALEHELTLVWAALEPGQRGLEELEAAWTPEQPEAARMLEEPATGTWAPGEPATGTWALGPEARLQRVGA